MKRILLIGGIIAALGAVLIAGLFLGVMASPARAQINQALDQVVRSAGARLPLPQLVAAQSQTQTPPQLQLKDEKGVLVAGVFVNSPADKAGIVRGDIITNVDNQAINTYADLKNVLSSHKAGDSVQVQVQHGDAQKTYSVTLAASPYQTNTQNNGAQGQAQPPAQNQPKASQLASLPFLGIVPSEEGRGGMKGFGFPGGSKGQGQTTQQVPGARIVQVASGSPAEKAGLKAGDVIASVDGTAINAQNSLQTLLANHKPGDSVKLSVGTIDTTNGTVTNQHDVTVTLGDNPNAQGKAYLGVSVAAGRPGGRFHGFGGGMPWLPGQNGTPNGGPNGANPGLVQHPGAVIEQVTAGGPAEKAGLKAGQFISAVDGKTLTNADDLVNAISSHKPGDVVTLTVFNPGTTTNSTDVKVTLGENPQKAGAAWLGIQFSYINMQPGQQPGSPTQSLPQG